MSWLFLFDQQGRPPRIEMPTFARYVKFMESSEGAMEPHDIFEGLRRSDEQTVRYLYKTCQEPITTELCQMFDILSLDANEMFKAAVVNLARQIQSGVWESSKTPYELIREWAISEYYLLDKTERDDEEAPAVDEGSQHTLWLIRDWRTNPYEYQKTDRIEPDGYRVWRIAGEIERNWQKNAAPQQSAEPVANKIWRIGLILLLLLTGGYAVYTYISRPPDLFHDNFSPPESLWADHRLRYEAAADSAGRPDFGEICASLLQEADQQYRAGRFEAAQDPLLLLVLDTIPSCQSDAWFYLALLRLEQNDPVTAIDCLTKIEDLEHFSEDITWYMALSMVMLEKQEPSIRDKTIRAVERVLYSSQREDRKASAEKMLRQMR